MTQLCARLAPGLSHLSRSPLVTSGPSASTALSTALLPSRSSVILPYVAVINQKSISQSECALAVRGRRLAPCLSFADNALASSTARPRCRYLPGPLSRDAVSYVVAFAVCVSRQPADQLPRSDPPDRAPRRKAHRSAHKLPRSTTGHACGPLWQIMYQLPDVSAYQAESTACSRYASSGCPR